MDKVILTNTLDDGAQIVPAPELEFVDNANEVISKAFSAASYHFHGYNPVKEAYYRGVEYTIEHLPEIVTRSSLEAFCNTVLGNNNAIAARRNALIEKFCFSSFSEMSNVSSFSEMSNVSSFSHQSECRTSNFYNHELSKPIRRRSLAKTEGTPVETKEVVQSPSHGGLMRPTRTPHPNLFIVGG